MPSSTSVVAYRRTVRSSTPSRPASSAAVDRCRVWSSSSRASTRPAGCDTGHSSKPGGSCPDSIVRSVGNREKERQMATFVLVPGFWLGAWAWRDVTVALRAQGHDVHPMTLTGVAERDHLAGPEVEPGHAHHRHRPADRGRGPARRAAGRALRRRHAGRPGGGPRPGPDRPGRLRGERAAAGRHGAVRHGAAGGAASGCAPRSAPGTCCRRRPGIRPPTRPTWPAWTSRRSRCCAPGPPRSRCGPPPTRSDAPAGARCRPRWSPAPSRSSVVRQMIEQEHPFFTGLADGRAARAAHRALADAQRAEGAWPTSST